MEMNNQLHSPAALSQGKDRRFVCSRSGSARFGENKDLLLLPGFERRFLGCPARRLATIPTELSWQSITVIKLYSIFRAVYVADTDNFYSSAFFF
jgi:hypothetical protein